MRLTLLALLICTNLFAATPPRFAVRNCRPNLQSFPSIQAAVESVPSGAIVLACPGTYPEQIQIAQAITLQGVNVGGRAPQSLRFPATVCGRMRLSTKLSTQPSRCWSKTPPAP
jgi:hypothetical protein